MHIIVGALIALAGIIFWLSRAAQGARELGDAVHDLKTLPRRHGFRKKAAKEGLELVTEPIDAATVLMIAIARLKGDGRVSDAENSKIIQQLVSEMALSKDIAEEKTFHLRWLSRSLIQPSSALYPMSRLLQKAITKPEARDLVNMLQAVASIGGDINDQQKEFIRGFQESQGLLR